MLPCYFCFIDLVCPFTVYLCAVSIPFDGGLAGVLLIDDSITRASEFAMIEPAEPAYENMLCADLPYEGGGLDAESIESLREVVIRAFPL